MQFFVIRGGMLASSRLSPDGQREFLESKQTMGGLGSRQQRSVRAGQPESCLATVAPTFCRRGRYWSLLFTFVLLLTPLSSAFALDATDVVVHLPLDEEDLSTTFHDNGGGEETAICTTCPTLDIVGQRGTGADCNGTNEWFDLDGGTGASAVFDATVTQRTTMFWYEADNLTPFQVLFEEGGAVNGLNVYIEAGRLYAGAWSESTGFNGAWPNVATDTTSWHHVALVVDSTGSGDIKLYYDGVLVDSDPLPTSISAHSGNDALCRMQNDTKTHQGDQSGNGNHFDGRVDDFYVFNRPLSLAEIQAYQTDVPYIISMQFDESAGASTFVNDEGGYADGTCSGGTCPTAGVATLSGSGLQFDGGNDGVYLDQGDGTNPTFDLEFSQRTVSLCFNSSDLVGNHILFEEGGSVNGLNVYTSGTTLYGGGWSESKGFNGEWASTPTAISTGTWYHVALVYDSARSQESRLYVDGVLVDTVNATQAVHAHTGDEGVGYSPDGTKLHTGDSNAADHYEGIIDSFVVADRVLSLAQIQELDDACKARFDARVEIVHTPEPWPVGSPGTFTITVTNEGPSDALDIAVTQTADSQFSIGSWTCVGSNGGVCDDASGSGLVVSTVDLPAFGEAEFTINASVAANESPTTAGSSASISHPSDTNSANDNDNASATLIRQADVAISKVRLPLVAPVAGGSVGYQITITNAGPSDAPGTIIADTFDGRLSGVSWTCSDTGDSICGAMNGTENINESVTVAEGDSVTFAVSASLDPTASGSLSNTATATFSNDPVSGNDSSQDTAAIVRDVDVSISKAISNGSAIPGTSIEFTIQASNSGLSAASATVGDTFSTDLQSISWTCSSAGGASCGAANGTGDILDAAMIPQAGVNTYVVTATIGGGSTGTLSNTATIADADDVTPGNNSSTVSQPYAPSVDVGVVSVPPLDPMVRGARGFCRFTISNSGPSDATGVPVTIPAPTQFESQTWSCSVAGGASCGPGGSGAVADSVTVPSGATVTYATQGVIIDTLPISGTVDCDLQTSPTNDSNAANDTVSDAVNYGIFLD